MIVQDYHIRFITPCFLGGADAGKAELRASSIRGQLRWWFRCLGGNLEEEDFLFGSVRENAHHSSKIVVRIAEMTHYGDPNWYKSIPAQGMQPLTYLLGFFCGRTGRLSPKGGIPPGSSSMVRLYFKAAPSPKLNGAVRAFFSLGAMGFRATRGAGAICSTEHCLTSSGWDDLVSMLKVAGFHVALYKQTFPDWVKLLWFGGGLLKDQLRGRDGLGIKAGNRGGLANPLGSASPRQSSVLHLRPVMINDSLRLCLIEAPHHKILGLQAMNANGRNGSIIERLRGNLDMQWDA